MIKRAASRLLNKRTRSAPLGAISLTLIFLFIEFFDELHYAIGNATLPAIRAELTLSYAQVGLLLGLPHIINTFVEPVLMLLGDTSLRKRLVIGGGLAVLVGLLLTAGATTFPMLLAAYIIGFPASGAFVSLSQASLMDANPGREPQAMARWTLAGSLGNLIGPLLVAGGFALALGWRWVFLVLAVFALGLLLFVSPRKFPTHPNNRIANDRLSLGLLLRNLREAIHAPTLLRWIILLDLSDLLLDVLTSYTPLYLTDVIGVTPTQTSLLLSLLMLASLAADALSIPLLERLSGRWLVRITAAISIGLYAAFLLSPWPWVRSELLFRIVLLILIRFSTIGWYSVLQGEAYASVPGRSGTVMAINSLSGLLGGGLVWLVGWIAELAGLPAAMWLLLLGPISLALFTPRDGKIRGAG